MSSNPGAVGGEGDHGPGGVRAVRGSGQLTEIRHHVAVGSAAYHDGIASPTTRTMGR
jgi:hypothetical protein